MTCLELECMCAPTPGNNITSPSILSLAMRHPLSCLGNVFSSEANHRTV